MVNKNSKAWTDFKIECANEIGRVQYCKENNDQYKGNLSARENGAQGGPIGGQMVKKIFEQAKGQMH